MLDVPPNAWYDVTNQQKIRWEGIFYGYDKFHRQRKADTS